MEFYTRLQTSVFMNFYVAPDFMLSEVLKFDLFHFYIIYFQIILTARIKLTNMQIF